ncbi:aldehyde dehydrogenase family protein [Yinghuangia aomiensis]
MRSESRKCVEVIRKGLRPAPPTKDVSSGLYLEGAFVSAPTIVSRSPQQPSRVVCEVPGSDARQVGDAAEAARRVGASWSNGMNLSARLAALMDVSRELEQRSGELADLMVSEVGKSPVEARGELDRAAAFARHFAQAPSAPMGSVLPSSGAPGSTVMTTRRPVGVAGLITPWNFPVLIPVWKALPALAAGNGVLWKPSEEATGIALVLGEIFSKNVPEGLFNVLPGDGETGQAVVSASGAVSFTGSVGVGGHIIESAAKNRIPVQAEMGGHSPSIVFPDSDPEAVAKLVAAAAFGYAGQRCTATRRVIVVGQNLQFVDALIAEVRQMRVGDPADPASDVGPVINERAQRAIQDAIKRAVSEGGVQLTGDAGADDREGWCHVAPALIGDVQGDHTLACEEVFGPVCALMTAPDANEAFRLANATPFGLAAAVFTKDLDIVAEAASASMWGCFVSMPRPVVPIPTFRSRVSKPRRSGRRTRPIGPGLLLDATHRCDPPVGVIGGDPSGSARTYRRRSDDDYTSEHDSGKRHLAYEHRCGAYRGRHAGRGDHVPLLPAGDPDLQDPPRSRPAGHPADRQPPRGCRRALWPRDSAS